MLICDNLLDSEDASENYNEERGVITREYTHLDATEAMKVLKAFMTSNSHPPENFMVLNRLQWTIQRVQMNTKTTEPSSRPFVENK